LPDIDAEGRGSHTRVMRFEHHREQLLPQREFLVRQARWTSIAGGVILGSLAVGVWGYHYFDGLPWVDSLLNASMILGGMGPVDPLKTSAGKVFASLYALYSGLALITIAGLLFAPLVHRFLHKFHIADK
jgi:hypothetical protein